jgi:succinate dehydrogenase flavoprotein subunit
VFGQRAGEYAAKWSRENGQANVDEGQVQKAIQDSLAPFDRGDSGENPYKVQSDLQDTMQALVGIVRNEVELRKGLEAVLALRARASRVCVPGNREYNPGWHTALDLDHLLTVSEAIARAAIERKESRGAHFREDFPDKDLEWGRTSLVVRRSATGEMQLVREPIPHMPPELKRIVEENR